MNAVNAAALRHIPDSLLRTRASDPSLRPELEREPHTYSFLRPDLGRTVRRLADKCFARVQPALRDVPPPKDGIVQG